MKKIIATLLLASLFLTSCGTDNNEENGGSNSGSGMNNDTTLGDTDGDGIIDDVADGVGDLIDDIMGSDSSDTSESSSGRDTESSSSTNGESETLPGGGTESNGTDMGESGIGTSNHSANHGSSNGGSMTSPVDAVKSSDDAINFINTNVYSLCREVLPMMTETKALSKSSPTEVKYNTGLSSTDGIDDIIVSESLIDMYAYSFVMLRTDGRYTEELAYSLGENVNRAKWGSVSADKVSSVIADHDIFLVMGAVDQVDTVMSAVKTAAEGVYNNIGSVVTVHG